MRTLAADFTDYADGAQLRSLMRAIHHGLVLLPKSFLQIPLERVDRDAILQHRIAMADSDLLIFQGLVIDHHAEGRSNLILSGTLVRLFTAFILSSTSTVSRQTGS